jgi:hypothetical protein
MFFVILVVGACIVVNGSCNSRVLVVVREGACNVIIITIASDIDVIVVGYIKPFCFVRTMDSGCNIFLVVIVVATCIVVNG